MTFPLLFISHKHSDTKIAETIANFVKIKSGGRVRIYLSSHSGYRGPQSGQNLIEALRNALWEASALILVYTSADQDWSYCMWECGVATDPKSPDTKIHVFQCGGDVPSPFADTVRINARKLDDVLRFTDTFLRDPNFFGQGEAIAPGFDKADSDKAAEELYNSLAAVLPIPEKPLIEEWSAWPYLKIEMLQSEADRMAAAAVNERLEVAFQTVSEHGVIVESDTRAAQIFGITSFSPEFRFQDLVKLWKEKFPSLEAAWFDSCCEQIMVVARKGLPIVHWAPVRALEGESEFTPILSRSRRIPSEGKVQFDIYLYNLSDPRSVPVTSRMIPAGSFFSKKMARLELADIRLKTLMNELNVHGITRVPFLNSDDHPLYIIHKSMIAEFITEQGFSAAEGKGLEDLTLADLLNEPAKKQMAQSTFALVSKKATLAEAKSAMLALDQCRDVFVTDTGGRNEPILGWLTNIRILRDPA